MANTNCAICCDTFTKVKRAPISCGKCDIKLCCECLEKYILSQESLTQVVCMTPDCDCIWDRAFLAEHLTQTCMRQKLPKHRANLLFQHAISRLPETMLFVERFQRADELEETRRNERKELKALRERARVLNGRQWDIGRQINVLRNLRAAPDSKSAAAREFVRHCPEDGCRGFLSTQWRCQICNLYVCSKCHAIKGHVPKGIKPTFAFEGHVCNENDVKTVTMLHKDTKSCPSCGVPIHKITGCDQMWCTQCQVAFSWRTGRRVNGVIHNPHFYQFQRDNGGGVAPRVPGDVRCGGLPGNWQFREKLRSKDGEALRTTIHPGGIVGYTDPFQLSAAIWTLHRTLNHFRHVELVTWNNNEQHIEQKDLELRIQYILKKKSAAKMKQQLMTCDKRRARKNDIFHILQLMDTVGTERLIAVYNNMTVENANICFTECERVRNYCNDELKKISVIDGLCVPIIGTDFYTNKEKFSKKDVGW